MRLETVMELQKKYSRQISDHTDLLEHLNDNVSLCEKLQMLLDFIQARHRFINRIAVAIHDPTSDLLKTYAHATEGRNPLPLYQAKLSQSESLSNIKNDRKPRVLNNMNPLRFVDTDHSRKVTEIGFQSSFTVPVYQNDHFIGFIFFNSSMLNAMQKNIITDLTVMAHLISVLLINELNFISTTKGVTRSMASLASYRDLETGQHLIRVSHFSRLIARALAEEKGLNDEYVEQMFLFSPLHDIGKIAVPDRILCKAGKLTDEEYAEMKLHTTRGKDMIRDLQQHLQLLSQHAVNVLENIVYHHHEAWDGSGYPDGLAGEAIPLEARILAVADVFDALTSRRVYKERWSFEQAMQFMQDNSGVKFDPACINVFHENRKEVESIVDSFAETTE